ncbi:hypothetical protein [Anaerobium acetethylicum]|uniref:hypothetical protein n=1 Tax=Anaerobium acetethylicum TaxID=1619234 RepID=UPI001112D97B|nr:hypothetical protein [Anaerobium acetethylicum]
MTPSSWVCHEKGIMLVGACIYNDFDGRHMEGLILMRARMSPSSWVQTTIIILMGTCRLT